MTIGGSKPSKKVETKDPQANDDVDDELPF
jgi:hypothetical protein